MKKLGWTAVAAIGIFSAAFYLVSSLPEPPNRPRVIWLASLLKPFFWPLSWLPLPVWWSGQWIRLRKLEG